MSAAADLLERNDWWWASLNHGGLLIAPSKLAELFPSELPPLPRWLAGHLRRDVVRLRDEPEHLGTFLDTVLEGVLGLDGERWLKGNDVGREWSRTAVTRDVIRPRRVWQGPRGAVLPVFVADAALLGGGGRDTGPVRLGVGRGRRAVSRVVEWLRLSGQKVALLASGRQLRLVHAGTDYDAFCEWDTELWFHEGAPGPQVTALRALLSAEALVPAKEGEPSRLLGAIQASRQGQAELSSELGERVRKAVELLIQESAPALEGLEAPAPGHVSHRDIYIAATRVVMRCVVILFAEARELLPRGNAIYESSYGIQGLREQLDRLAGGRAAERLRHSHMAWPRLLSLFSLVFHGSQHEALVIPRYGGGLFTPGDGAARDPVLRALAAFESAENAPSDAAVHRMLELLCRSRVRVRQGRTSRWVEAPVDFSDLSSEYLGILYEGLLDFELRRAPAGEPMVFLDVGDQPVLPLSRLDGMNNAELAKLFEKLAKATKKAAASEEEEGEGGEDSEEEGQGGEESEGGEESAEGGEAPPVTEAAPAPASAEEELDSSQEDVRRRVREHVQLWAEQAVKAAKLVRYPRNDADAQAREQFNRDVTAKAKELVARVVLPGQWFLVRWGGTRKGSGTFYTRPQLAGPIVRRALQPLAYEAVQQTEDPETGVVTVTEWAPRRPEEILALKVCDPAMGSGSFLVSALRYLTEALRESLHHHDRLVERPDSTICRLADGLPVEHPSHETLPVPKDAEDFDEKLRARLKRHVVERCLYGVDLDPLAVELARTALWVETMDYQLPFGFLDHKLKCGNALVGCWFDRFQDYPVMAWEREGGDKGHDRFVHHYREVVTKRGKFSGETKKSGDKWTAAIKEKRAEVLEELRSWIQQRDAKQGDFGWLIDSTQADALHQAAIEAFERMHALPVHQTEEREEIYRKEILESEPLRKLKAAFDTWCALWFWPGDELDSAPGPMAFLHPSEAARAYVERLVEQHRFFHWELEFPDVFTGPTSGFHAVVGNPPWETIQPSSVEFFSNLDPLYRTYTKQEAVHRQRLLFEDNTRVEADWLIYCARLKAFSNWLQSVGKPFGDERLSLGRGKDGQIALQRWSAQRAARATYADTSHPFQHQGSGKPYTYKMFLEVAHALLAREGRFGLLVPSGLYSDHGSQSLRELFLTRCAWTHLYAFQNERFVFETIHHSFKMAVVHVQKAAQAATILARFRLGPGDSPEAYEFEADLQATGEFLPVAIEDIRRFSPKTKALLESRTPKDIRVLDAMYRSGCLIGDSGDGSWSVQYRQGDFNMTSDSKLFPPRAKWEANGYQADGYGHWIKGPWRPYKGASSMLSRSESTILSADGGKSIEVDEMEDVALPLYQGIMVRAFDSCAKGWMAGTGLRAVWEEFGGDVKRVLPQYLIGIRDFADSGKAHRGCKLVYRRIARTTDARTWLGSVLLDRPVGDSLFCLLPRAEDANVVLALSGVLNSFVYDWVLRSRLAGTNLSWFVLEETPGVRRRPEDCAFVALLAVRLSGVMIQHAPLWIGVRAEASIGRTPWKRLWAITEHERLRLRSVLDAVVAELYGLDLDDFAWILRDCDHPVSKVCDKPFARTLDPKGFWRVDKEKDPELRHPVLSLVAFHELKRIGLDAFLALNDGDGWMLPETLRLADYGLGHDDRAKEPQPVASRLGERFLPWQLEQSVEESWEECRRHAELIAKIVPPPPEPAAAATPDPSTPRTPRAGETDLFGNPLEKDLFGNVIESRRKKRRR